MTKRANLSLQRSLDEKSVETGFRQASWHVGPGLLAGLVLFVMFGVGVVTGIVVERRLLRLPPQPTANVRVPRAMVPWRPLVPGAAIPPPRDEVRAAAMAPSPFVARFARDLELTAAQRAAVDSVIAQEFAVVSAIREEAWPRVRALVEGTRVRIDSLLTPAQRERYRAMLAEQQQRIERIEAERRAAPRSGPL